MTPGGPACRIGLVASGQHRSGRDAALLRFMAAFRPLFAGGMRTELSITGATYDVLQEAGLLDGYAAHRLAPARDGGLIALAALLVGLEPGCPGLDWIIYLQDPYDPTSLYPEAQALKRQCTVHGKPFLSTEAAASEWCTLEWLSRQPLNPMLPPLVDRWVRPVNLAQETLGLIAHDAFKPDLLAFAARHHALLDRFGRRLATGTTGSLLNGNIPERLSSDAGTYETLPLHRPAGASAWVHAMLSGPRGGDAQIAYEVLEGRCRRVIFLEDPHVAREHEADIQLLERATKFAGVGCLCLNSVATAGRWAEMMSNLSDVRSKAGTSVDETPAVISRREPVSTR